MAAAGIMSLSLLAYEFEFISLGSKTFLSMILHSTYRPDPINLIPSRYNLDVFIGVHACNGDTMLPDYCYISF